jgi:hypothetical protein
MESEDELLFLEAEAAVQNEFQDNLPDGWVLSHSRKHGRMYYFNRENGESRWEHPLIPDEEIQVRIICVCNHEYSTSMGP